MQAKTDTFPLHFHAKMEQWKQGQKRCQEQHLLSALLVINVNKIFLESNYYLPPGSIRKSVRKKGDVTVHNARPFSHTKAVRGDFQPIDALWNRNPLTKTKIDNSKDFSNILCKEVGKTLETSYLTFTDLLR